MSLVDTLLGFGFGQGLDVCRAFVMSDQHDFQRGGLREEKNRGKHVHYKIHRRYIVIVDDDAIERFEFSFRLFNNFDFGGGLNGLHASDYSIAKNKPASCKMGLIC